MKFEKVTLDLGTTGFDIHKADEGDTIVCFYDTYDLREVDVTVDNNYLTAYDKDGEVIMQATIYKKKQEPGEE